jgi:hypothetical protein
MKIIHVIIGSDVLGGAQTPVRELSVVFRSPRHEVTVITGSPGIFTDRLRQGRIPWLPVRSLVRPLKHHLDLLALVQLWCALRRLKPDLVCSHSAKAGSLARAAARLRHNPSVFTPHGWSTFDRTSLKPNALLCWPARRSARMMCQRPRPSCYPGRKARPALQQRFGFCLAYSSMPQSRTL